MRDYLIKRLGEASTWRGIVAALTAAGVTLSPDAAEQLSAAGLALIGLIGILSQDARP